MDPSVLDDAYLFWFGDLAGPDDDPPADVSQRWFRQSEAFDDEVREAFAAHIEAVAGTAWDLPALSRRQQVGLVIFLDQFPRNLYRETGEAFAYDARARAIARTLVAGGTARFFPVERTFLYMPLMHSEDIHDQDRCAALFAAEAVAAEGEAAERFRSYLDYAFRHRDLIRRFGRFPHRNAVLGRESTAEEAKFLAEKGRGY